MRTPYHNPSSQGLNPLFRMGNILNNEIEYNHVRDFVRAVIKASAREGIDESTTLSIIKNYFHQLTDSILNVCAEYYLADDPIEIEPRQESEKLLDVNDVAQILKVTPQYIRKLLKNGKIPFQNYGERQIRIKESDIKRYLESKK